MSNLYSILSELCSESGISGYKMCKDLGIQPSIMTDLKMGRRSGVNAATADKIAKYFNVSVGYLLGNEKKPTAHEDDEVKDEFIAFYGKVKKDLSQDDIDDIKMFLQMKANKKKELDESKNKER